MRAQLVAHLRNRLFHGFDVEFMAAQLLAVLAKVLRHLISQRAEHQIDGILKKASVAPHAQHPPQPGVAARKQARRRKASFELALDDWRVEKNARADLQSRRAPVPAGQGHQIWTRHDAWN